MRFVIVFLNEYEWMNENNVYMVYELTKFGGFIFMDTLYVVASKLIFDSTYEARVNCQNSVFRERSKAKFHYANFRVTSATSARQTRDIRVGLSDRDIADFPVSCNVIINSAFHPSGVGKSSTSLLAGVKAGHFHLCRVAGNAVWYHMAGDVP